MCRDELVLCTKCERCSNRKCQVQMPDYLQTALCLPAVCALVLVFVCLSVTMWVSVCFQDEGALVRAARNLGFVFSGRTPDSVIVEMVRGNRQVQWKACKLLYWCMDQLYLQYDHHDDLEWPQTRKKDWQTVCSHCDVCMILMTSISAKSKWWSVIHLHVIHVIHVQSLMN